MENIFNYENLEPFNFVLLLKNVRKCISLLQHKQNLYFTEQVNPETIDFVVLSIIFSFAQASRLKKLKLRLQWKVS